MMIQTKKRSFMTTKREKKQFSMFTKLKKLDLGRYFSNANVLGCFSKEISNVGKM